MESETELVVQLKLNREEATWLKAVMQNPLCGKEDPRDTLMRGIYWRALDVIE